MTYDCVIHSSKLLQCLLDFIQNEFYLNTIIGSEDEIEFEQQDHDRSNQNSRHAYLEGEDFEEGEKKGICPFILRECI